MEILFQLVPTFSWPLKVTSERTGLKFLLNKKSSTKPKAILKVGTKMVNEDMVEMCRIRSKYKRNPTFEKSLVVQVVVARAF